jgi:hypothetical protein
MAPVLSHFARRADRLNRAARVCGRAVLLAGLALAVTSPAAPAKAGDAAATQALARATDALVRAASPDVPRGLAAVKRYASQTAAQCPRVAAGSPQDHNSEQLDDELIGAMTVVGYRTAATPIATFAHAVKGLHWSNRRLTRTVRTFATKLQDLSRLATPNVCGDIEAWAASGFKTLSASTVPFVRRYLAVTPEAEEVPLMIRLLMPYATPSDVPILHRVERLETRLGEAEAAAVETYSRLILALELNQ